MKIVQKHLANGAALSQLVDHEAFKSLGRLDATKGHYLVNGDRRILVKTTKEATQPWRFGLKPEDLKVLRDDIASKQKTFLCLICGTTSICVLDQADLDTVLDVNADGKQGLKVESPVAGMRVRGPKGPLKKGIGHNVFPAKIFA